MTPLFLARRRAERFDSLVEGGRRDDVDRATSDLLELVGALRAVPDAEPRPEFVAGLRERLMTAAETELVPVAKAPARDDVARLTLTPTRTRRERRIGVALGAAAIIGASASVAVASQGAIPGDALYPVKRAIENTQAGFRVSDDAKGESILGNASTRLDEVDELTQQPDPNAQLVTQTLNTFSAQATDAGHHLMSSYEQNGDPQAIKDLHGFAHQSIDSLNALEAVIPPQARPALLAAAAAIADLDSQASNLCPDSVCGAPLTELPSGLMADAAPTTGSAADAAGNAVAGQATGTPTTAAGHQHNGGKGSGQVSGLNPPETPIELPPASAGSTTGVGSLLPTAGPAAGGTPASGGGTNTSGGGHHGHGGKNAPVDLAPVTDTVNQVVTGAVDGVNGLLNGLTGGATATP